jgi:peptidoglycan/LPS O-acetylase OafA/YrhL
MLARSTPAPMTLCHARLIVHGMLILLRRIYGCSIGRGIGDNRPAPVEARVLRSIGFTWLVALVIVTFTTHPHPGFRGRSLFVLTGFAVMVLSAAAARPGPPRVRPAAVDRRPTIGALIGVTVGASVLALAQPHGIWLAGPYFVAIMAAITLDRKW